MSPKTVGRQAHGKSKCVRSFECVGPVLRSLEEFVPIETQGRWSQHDIYQCLVGMAVERLSVHSMDSMMSNRPCETSMWHHLGKIDMNQLMSANAGLLVNPVLDVMPDGKGCIFAIDITDDPYYGEVTDVNMDYVVGDRIKKSTNLFYRYISLYLIDGDRKFTLAMIPVKNKTPLIPYVEQLLDTIDQAGLSIKVLLLDRGFYSLAVLSLMQKRNIPHIMPVKKQSNRMKTLLSTGRSSRYASYTMKSRSGSLEVKIAIAVKYLQGRCNKHGRKPLGYVVHGIDWKPNKIADIYEKRFGIEASYRMRNIVRPRTTTKNPTIRYLFALISMLLKNIWVAIRWRHFPEPRRGPRRIQQDTFRFDYFRLIIWTTITQKLRFKTKIPTTRPRG